MRRRSFLEIVVGFVGLGSLGRLVKGKTKEEGGEETSCFPEPVLTEDRGEVVVHVQVSEFNRRRKQSPGVFGRYVWLVSHVEYEGGHYIVGFPRELWDKTLTVRGRWEKFGELPADGILDDMCYGNLAALVANGLVGRFRMKFYGAPPMECVCFGYRHIHDDKCVNFMGARWT